MGPSRYEIVVAEPMSATAIAAFPELALAANGRGTVLYGPVRDESELYGLLDRFFAMGLTIVGLHRLPD